MTANNPLRAHFLDASKFTHTRCLLTTQEVAALIGLSTSYFEKGRIYGYGPNFLRVGCKILYHINALNQWLADHECDPKGGANV